MCIIRLSGISLVLCILSGHAGLRDGIAAGNNPRQQLSLNGRWDFLLDRANAGLLGAWFLQDTFQLQENAADRTRPRPRVPGCWEEWYQDYEGVAWYGRTFHIPESWRGKAVRIRFQAVNYIAQVWINDQVVGHHEGGYTPFEFHIEDLLQYGVANFIAVRVVGAAITAEHSSELQKNEAPHWRGAITGGIWQPVSLVATEATYLQDVFVQPDIHTETATAQLTIEHRGTRNEDMAAQIRIIPGQQDGRTIALESQKIRIKPGDNVVTMAASIRNPRLWSPEAPNLYVVETTLSRDGEILDVLTTRFGMREFTARKSDFYLNDQKFFMKAGFWEGMYPMTVSYPASPEIVRREIQLAKDAGFNTLRPWRRPPPAPILDIADEMGILIIDSPPIECMKQWPRLTPEIEQRLKTEVEGMVRRDRNHPSVIIWEIFNEINRPYLTRYKHPMSLAARNLDPTRIVVDESGGHHASKGSWAYLPQSWEPVPINERHRYLPAPSDQQAYDYFRTFGSSDMLTIMSEFGYGAPPDLPRNMAQYRRTGNPIMPDYRIHEKLATQYVRLMHRYGLYDIWPDLSALCQASQEVAAVANKMQAEALRLNPNIDGYALHAYTGGDWVIGAGILDLWREPKASYYMMQDVQQPRYLAVRVTPHNVYAGQEAMLDVTGIVDDPVSRCQLEVTIRNPEKETVFESCATVNLAEGVTGLLHESVRVADLSGRYRAQVVLQRDGKTVTENTYSFYVVASKDLCVPRRPVAVLEDKGGLERKLRDTGMNIRRFKPGDEDWTPVLVTSDPIRHDAVTPVFDSLIAYVKRGGTAVLLDPRRQVRGLVEAGGLGIGVRIVGGTGNWHPVNHFVHEHPIFAGVPTRCFMGQEYANVVPRITIRGLDVQPIAGALGWDTEDDYRGIRDVWGGADLFELPCGKGALLISTLRLVENLGKDPIADKILYNIIRHVTSRHVKTAR